MPIKTFKGLILNEGVETIPLTTRNGSIGYRIVKFQIMPKVPGTIAQESISKIFKIPPTATPDGSINFSDQTLLAAAFYQDSTSAGDNQATTIIFDNEVFNQDIYVTNKDVSGNTEPINYYIELEQIKLDIGENTVATLKDIRNLWSRFNLA